MGSESRLRGGIQLHTQRPDRVGYHDPIYDPIWAACEEADLPVNFHAIGGTTYDRPLEPEPFDGVLYGPGPVGAAIAFHDRRPDYSPLWFFILGGVFDRFPRLKLCFSEQLAKWVPHELARLEDFFHDTSWTAIVRKADVVTRLKMTPREYWQRNCFIGASFMSREEANRRHDIGMDSIMWASDYPHPEGTSPVTLDCLRHVFAEVPPEELRAILAGNAANAYGFDLSRLEEVARHCGPRVDNVAEPLEEVPLAYRSKHAFRPI